MRKTIYRLIWFVLIAVVGFGLANTDANAPACAGAGEFVEIPGENDACIHPEPLVIKRQDVE